MGDFLSGISFLLLLYMEDCLQSSHNSMYGRPEGRSVQTANVLAKSYLSHGFAPSSRKVVNLMNDFSNIEPYFSLFCMCLNTLLESIC